MPALQTAANQRLIFRHREVGPRLQTPRPAVTAVPEKQPPLSPETQGLTRDTEALWLLQQTAQITRVIEAACAIYLSVLNVLLICFH